MTDPLLWALIALQISLGAFDTLYHHELTERLAWRPSQAQELRLHAVRNGFYAVIFGVLGWAEPHGLWAWGLILLLAVEVGITLWDFVEEDLSRRLPATERVTHTLLALNYGAILVLAMPVLARWAGQETALIGAYYGPWSWLCAGAVVAVCVFGLRDWLAARRAPHLAEPDPAPLAAELNPRHILVTGATGFVGCRLVAALVGAGHRVTVLTRDPDKAAGLATPFTLVTDLDQIPSDARIDAIVNLAGESVAGGLWTQAKRDRIIGSRVAMAEALDRLVARLKVKPASFISASAIGWYGPRDARPVDEGVKPCPSFSHVSCAIAELAADAIGRHGLRVVNLRIGLVLASEGGLLARLLTPFEFGLGGPIGQGRQMMSWIHRDDLVRAILHCIEEESLRGPVNATAPHPVSNAAFARGLGQALGRPALLPMPAPALRLLGGDMARELLLSGQAVLPTKLTGSGFRFRHATPRVGPRRNPTRAPSPNSATSPRGESCKHHTHVTKMSAIAPISLWITWAEQPPATRGADGSFPGQRDQAGAARGSWRPLAGGAPAPSRGAPTRGADLRNGPRLSVHLARSRYHRRSAPAALRSGAKRLHGPAARPGGLGGGLRLHGRGHRRWSGNRLWVGGAILLIDRPSAQLWADLP
ncbi:MAG: TIGR01777 family oxidoreductase [Pseudomonadota bacterium]